jgi:hypothetical protein
MEGLNLMHGQFYLGLYHEEINSHWIVDVLSKPSLEAAGSSLQTPPTIIWVGIHHGNKGHNPEPPQMPTHTTV